MAAVQPIRKQSYEQIYLLLKTAILQQHCLSAYYKGHLRLFLPCILGRSKGIKGYRSSPINTEVKAGAA